MRLVSLAVLALALSACSPRPEVPAEPETASNEPVPEPTAAEANAPLAACAPATAAGWCGVTFGVSPTDAKAAFPVPLVRYSGDTNVVHDPQLCFEMFAQEPIQGVSFLAEDNRIGRVDIVAEGPKTADGFGVGSTADEIRAKYGAALQEGPNKYEPEVTELTLEQAPGKILFEIQDGKVRAWRAGIAPTIDYVERCG